ncbi:MoaD/ThiS family protein [Candidatus Micrarchaeota archaeon]|nr:MoaD/ThiS family protein [Candidatus Micrarchaeota archaeon]
MELVLDNEAREMEFSGTLAELLKELKVMREEVVVKVNGKLAPETRKIRPCDKIEVLRVVFGG